MECGSGCSLPLQSLGLLSSLKTLSLIGFRFIDETTMVSHSHNEWQNLTNLEELKLIDSSLPSKFIRVIGSLPSLRKFYLNALDVDHSLSLHGKLYLFHSLRKFYLNALECLPLQSLGLFSSLKTLSLRGALFSGNFSLTNLFELDLDGNNFSGMIPNVLSNCSQLKTLDLSNNNLFGKIPSWIGNMPMLSTFDVSRNQLFGGIPQWIGNASQLKQIAMADNHLQGSIPRSFCNLNHRLELLDLSVNNFSGTLPSCFKPLSIREIYLSKNMLQGPLPNAFRYSSTLVTLDLSYNHFSGNIPNWISNLSELSYLLLKRNHFEGEIPIQLCKLTYLSLIDLSQNNLSGAIPSCLKVTALNNIHDYYEWDYNREGAFMVDTLQSTKSSFLKKIGDYNYNNGSRHGPIEKPIEYTTKSRSYTYKKRMLQYMSGIDLSCNKLTGDIPHETENISRIYTLNLSHNSLRGPIPRAFSNLKDIESLDLSYNNLIGNVPPEFAVLHFLQYFNVSYNNLSGKTPERIGQLGAFDESSYVGNPFLCGSLVGKNCSRSAPLLAPMASTENTEEHGLIDMEAFYASFIVCYIVVILCIAAVLYINPYWRQAWFYYMQTAAMSCYYFVIDNLPRKFRC